MFKLGNSKSLYVIIQVVGFFIGLALCFGIHVYSMRHVGHSEVAIPMARAYAVLMVPISLLLILLMNWLWKKFDSFFVILPRLTLILLLIGIARDAFFGNPMIAATHARLIMFGVLVILCGVLMLLEEFMDPDCLEELED